MIDELLYLAETVQSLNVNPSACGQREADPKMNDLKAGYAWLKNPAGYAFPDSRSAHHIIWRFPEIGVPPNHPF